MKKALVTAAAVITAVVLASTAFAGSRADTYYTVVCAIPGVGNVEFESVDANAYDAKLAALEKFPRGDCWLTGPFTNP